MKLTSVTCKRCTSWLAISAAAFGAALYILAIYKLAIDVPREDDYVQVMAPILGLNAATTTGEQIALLTTSYLGHQPVFGTATAYALYRLQGRVNFRSIIFIGNLGLLVLAVALTAGARRTIASPALFCLFPLLLLSPIHQANAVWATSCLNHFWAIAFSALALLLVTRPDGLFSFGGACAFAAVAAFTNGEGMLCLVAGLVALVVQRRWKDSAVWFALLVLVFANHIHNNQSDVRPEISLRSAGFFVIMLGSPISNFLLRLLAPFRDILGVEGFPIVLFRLCCGIGLILVGFLLWKRRYYRRNLFLSMVILDLTLVCAATAVARGPSGLATIITTRYFIFSLPLCICLALALADSSQSAIQSLSPVWMFTLSLWAVVWCLYFPYTCQVSDRQAKLRQQFIERQTPEAIHVGVYTADVEQQMRNTFFETLWQSYLSGLLPLSELHNPSLPLCTLRAIAREKSETHQLTDSQTKLVTHFRMSGDRVVLDTATAASPSEDKGAIHLRQGRLYYTTPSK